MCLLVLGVEEGQFLLAPREERVVLLSRAALPHLPPAGAADEPTLPSQVATPRREHSANGPCCGARHGRMHQAEKHQADAQIAVLLP